MIVNNKELNKINLALKELAIKESNKQISEEEYEKQRKILRAKSYEIIQNYIKSEKNKSKKEPEKKTVNSKLSRFW